MIAKNVHRGMTLGEMIKASLKVAKVYSRGTEDMFEVASRLVKICSEKDWRILSTTLTSVLQKFDE